METWKNRHNLSVWESAIFIWSDLAELNTSVRNTLLILVPKSIYHSYYACNATDSLRVLPCCACESSGIHNVNIMYFWYQSYFISPLPMPVYNTIMYVAEQCKGKWTISSSFQIEQYLNDWQFPLYKFSCVLKVG